MKCPAFFVVLLVLSLAVQAPAATTYRLTDLGTLGGPESRAFGLNNLGQVVGDSLTASGERHAFLFSGGTMSDLGVLANGHHVSRATDINDAGIVVGESSVNDGGGAASGRRPFIYQAGSMTNPGSLGGNYGFASGINEAGVVVGLSSLPSGVTHAFRYDGAFQDLGSFSGTSDYSEATSINDGGAIAGISVANGTDRGFAWTGSGLVDLGDLPGGAASTRAYRINGAGQIVGESGASSPGVSHAFIWENGSMTDLGVLPDGSTSSWAGGINDAGMVVGSSYAGTSRRAFAWTPGVGMMDLNGLHDATIAGWSLLDARDVNDAGQIVGIGSVNGELRGYLLTPVPNTSAMTILSQSGAVSASAGGQWPEANYEWLEDRQSDHSTALGSFNLFVNARPETIGGSASSSLTSSVDHHRVLLSMGGNADAHAFYEAGTCCTAQAAAGAGYSLTFNVAQDRRFIIDATLGADLNGLVTVELNGPQGVILSWRFGPEDFYEDFSPIERIESLDTILPAGTYTLIASTQASGYDSPTANYDEQVGSAGLTLTLQEVVPEPSSFVLCCCGLPMLCRRILRRRRLISDR